MQLTTWRKSSFSDQAGSDCIEVAFAVTGVAMRDSKNTDGPVLGVPVDAWHRLLAARGLRDVRAAMHGPAAC